MKNFILLICLCPLFSQAQKIPDFGFDKVHLADGDKTIQAEILPVSSAPKAEPNRTYFWYNANVIHSTRGGFSGRLLNGSYAEYYPDKNLKEQGHFNKGLKDGVWKDWTDNGLLINSYTWSNGIRSGKFALYDEQGRVKQSGKYRNDIIDSATFWQRVNIFKKKRP